MAEIRPLTRPSLQLCRAPVRRCAHAALSDCALHNPDVTRDIFASSQDCSGSRLVAPVICCLGGLDRSAACDVATPVFAPVDKREPNNTFGVELAGEFESPARMQRNAFFP